MSALDEAKALVDRLEAQAKLEAALEKAAAKHAEDPTEKNLAAHDAAAVALVEHRAAGPPVGGPRVGGDVVVTTDAAGEGDQ